MATAPSPLLYSAESWEKIYTAFDQVSFTAYDYDTVKQSLLDYLKLNYPENFNDYIESSALVALIELFAYTAELLAYRVDLSVHEVLITDAQRKSNILKLAKLISYTTTRNLPLRGLVKLTSVSISEDVRDSQGNSLANRVIKWNDPNNSLWREQFFTVLNKVLSQPFGSPFKSFQLDDTIFQQYEVTNVLETDTSRSSFRNGVLKFQLAIGGQSQPFELVPADVDQNGVFERSPNPNAYFTLLYADDGYGDGSDTTGFMLYVKQGALQKLTYVFDSSLPNRTLDLSLTNVNDVDVWVQQVDDQGVITQEWENIPNLNGINLAFNNVNNLYKYEIETLENDAIRLIFGDGDFAAIPLGIFNLWARQSTVSTGTVSKTDIVDQTGTFAYTSKTGKLESISVTYSLASALQNASPSEDQEHIRAAAPAVYYTQNRMVNGQDYNSFMLQDPSILRLKSINRTFAGQPKYLTWNDASGEYQNIKLFGNDARAYYSIDGNAVVTTVSSRSMIDDILEPALATPGIYNLLVFAFYSYGPPLSDAYIRPRTRFIEDASQLVQGAPFQEKTLIQGALDRHWYGEPDSTVLLDVDLSDSSSLPKTTWAIVNDDTDHLIYDANQKIVLKDPTTGVYTAVPTPGNVSGVQESALRQKRFGISFNPDRAFASELVICPGDTDPGGIPTNGTLTSADLNQLVRVEETYTVELVNVDGTYTVYGSVSGPQPNGSVGQVYDNGALSFLIGFPPGSDETLVIGDAFIIDIQVLSNTMTPTVHRQNLTGVFQLIDEGALTVGAENSVYNVQDPVNSWIFIIERTDDASGNPAYWTITTRSFNLVVESPTTKFWYNQTMNLVDNETKLPVRDQVRLLKSNLTVDGTQAIGSDQLYNVVGDVKYPDGEVNFNALSVSPANATDLYYAGDGSQAFDFEFLRFIGDSTYVYFSLNLSNGHLTPIPATLYLESLDYVDNQSSGYVRKLGREGLDFMWQHFTPDTNVIDPSPSNLIDTYLMTRGYYTGVQAYLNGTAATLPAQPTSLELRNSYATLLDSKMISDTVVLHSGRLKLLFGAAADPQLRSSFRVVVAPGAKLTGDQIRASVLNLINAYFSIDNWDFGQSFYATELCAVIHQQLATEISSVVLVPQFPSNYFGDMFFIRAADDEIFVSAATLDNITIIDGLDKLTLKQKP